MAAKKLNKINRFNLIGLTKRFFMDKSAIRIVTSSTSKQLNAISSNVQADYSKFLSKTSATSSLKVQTAGQQARRRLENELAAEQVRKCNEILKEHFLQRRTFQKTLINAVKENEPALSRKLKKIMSKDAANSTATISSKAEHFKRFLDNGNTRSSINDKHVGSYLNRCHMKIPSPTIKELEDRNLISRANKVAKLSDNKPPMSTSSTDIKKHSRLRGAKSQTQNMWLIGSRKIPRLT